MNIEGKNPVKELILSGKSIEKIILEDGSKDSVIREIFSLAREREIKVQFADKRALDKLSETGHHQGAIAEQAVFDYSSLSSLINKSRSEGKDIFFLILDEIADPHNLGSIIRVAECAGVTGVIIPNRRSAIVNETVVRTSAGATAYVPVVKVNNLSQTIKELKQENIFVYALDMDGEVMYKANLTGDIAMVIGNEGSGVRELTRKLCDEIISIPMSGKLNSLNAGVSAGIGVWEAIRQRRK